MASGSVRPYEMVSAGLRAVVEISQEDILTDTTDAVQILRKSHPCGHVPPCSSTSPRPGTIMEVPHRLVHHVEGFTSRLSRTR